MNRYLDFVKSLVRTDAEFIHAKHVAENFPEYSIEYIISCFHDLVEDEYISLNDLSRKFQLPYEIFYRIYLLSRNPEETYFEYINKIKTDEVATKVKLADLMDNLNRCESESLKKRYLKAINILKEK